MTDRMAFPNVEENDNILLFNPARPDYTLFSLLCALKCEEKSQLCICIMYESPFYNDLIFLNSHQDKILVSKFKIVMMHLVSNHVSIMLFHESIVIVIFRTLKTQRDYLSFHTKFEKPLAFQFSSKIRSILN